MRKILVLNGPNLDMLGSREPDVYGYDTLRNLENDVKNHGKLHNIDVMCYQTNSEGGLISKIHSSVGKYEGIVFNPGAFTHYSIALHDAIESIDVPVVEVHLSDIASRESYRRLSVTAPACVALVKGLGVKGYNNAIDYLTEQNEFVRFGDNFKMPTGSGIFTGIKMYQNADEYDFVSDEAVLTEVAHSQMTPITPLEEINAVDCGQLATNRQEIVRGVCDQLGVAGLLIRDTSNIYWTTAFDGIFDSEKAHALLITDEGIALHTDSRYSNALRAAVAKIGSDIVVNDDVVSHAEFAYNFMTKNGTRPLPGRLGIEDTISYSEFVQMVEYFKSDGLAPTAEVVLGLRSIKDKGEIARMRASQALTDAAFNHILQYIKPGVTEKEIQVELEDFMVHHGADGSAFRPIVACGVNSADPHAIPSNAKLEAGQCVVLDFGARVYGYCSDMTRTVFLGEPQGIMVSAWETLCRATEWVEAIIKPGTTSADIQKLAEHVLSEGGFHGMMGHGIGHGVGLDPHEPPALNGRSNAALAEGNVITVEPGIYIPNEFGMRLEDCGLVTADGFEVFTKSSHEMVVL